MYEILRERSVISIAGEDRFKFLQGLISNDVEKLHSTKAIYACMLTPQGKYFVDMFLLNKPNEILLDIPLIRQDDLLKKLKIYKLRSNIVISEHSEYQVLSFIDESMNEKNVFEDPRTTLLGKRGLIKQDDLSKIVGSLKESKDAYDLLRINHFIPDGEKDLMTNKSFLLEYGLDQLNAIDYKKGCYVGQELVARAHYTGTIRKEIVQIRTSSNELPEISTKIFAGEQKLGTICSSVGNIGLALVRTEDVKNLSDGQVIMAADKIVKLNFREK